MAKDKHVVAPGCAVVTKKGVIGPGEEIKETDLATPENFPKLVEKKKIIKDSKYVNDEDAVFKAPEIKKEEPKKEKKTDNAKENKTQGATKKD
jgi:hypothetical protein